MSEMRVGFPTWSSCLLFLLVLGFSPSESADLISRCPPQVPRTRFLKAADWGKCYEFNLQERTWREANTICAKKGGHLVTIKEERIQIFILQSLAQYRWPRNGLWIGATDKEKEMEWVWVTGEKVKDGFSRWAPGQPSCGFFCFEDCAIMRWKEGGRWHDYRCSWLEDYSSICEYDMLPEPTTVKSTTSTTTTVASSASTSASSTAVQTATETVPVNRTSVAVSSTGRLLNSEYLVHGQRGQEDKGQNNTQKQDENPEIVFQPADVGMGGAREEQVQERMSSSAASLNLGTVAVVVVTVLTSLAVGLCIFFIMKRRHRKQIREDARGIGYENPYYEESKACLAKKGTGSNGGDTDGETEEQEAVSVAICSGKADSAVGFKASATSKNVRETKLPPVPPPEQQRCVMNNYDMPPARTTRMPRTNKKDSDKSHYVSGNEQPAATGYGRIGSRPVSKEIENCYDEIKREQSDGRYAYDVPRVSRQQLDQSGYTETDDMEHTYGNSFEENIYESVDNLQAIIEQGQTPVNTMVVENIEDDDDGKNRYVPFMFDTPTESS